MLPMAGLLAFAPVEAGHCSRREMESSVHTVDREAETADSTDEPYTVPRDDETEARLHLLRLFYPPDTDPCFVAKFPTGRCRISANSRLKLGRAEGVDVLLNEKHMPRNFAEIWCIVDEVSGEPRWFIRNASDKKPVRINVNGRRVSLKHKDERAIEDGSEVKLEGLRFVARTEDGDFGEMKEFEVEILPMETGSSSGSIHRQNSSSTDSGSLTSARALQRAGVNQTGEGGVVAGSNMYLGAPLNGALPGVQASQFTAAASAYGAQNAACCPNQHLQSHSHHAMNAPGYQQHGYGQPHPHCHAFPGYQTPPMLNQPPLQGHVPHFSPWSQSPYPGQATVPPQSGAGYLPQHPPVQPGLQQAPLANTALPELSMGASMGGQIPYPANSYAASSGLPQNSYPAPSGQMVQWGQQQGWANGANPSLTTPLPLHGPLSMPQAAAGSQIRHQLQITTADSQQAFVAQPESAMLLSNQHFPSQNLHRTQNVQIQQASSTIIANPTSEDQNPDVYQGLSGSSRPWPVAPPARELESLKLGTPIQVTEAYPTEVTHSQHNDSLQGSGGWNHTSSTNTVVSCGHSVTAGVRSHNPEEHLSQTQASQQNSHASQPQVNSIEGTNSAGSLASFQVLSSQQNGAGDSAGRVPAGATLSSITLPAANGNTINLRQHQGVLSLPSPTSPNQLFSSPFHSIQHAHGISGVNQGTSQGEIRGQTEGLVAQSQTHSYQGQSHTGQGQTQGHTSQAQGHSGQTEDDRGDNQSLSQRREPEEDDERQPQEHEEES